MPRRRPSRTTRARSVPGADGIAIDDLVGLGLVEDPAEVRRCAPSTRTPSTRMPALERVVVDEADRVDVELRVAQDLAQDEPAALAGADDQHAARALRARGCRAAGPRRRSRATNRAPPTNASVSRKNRTRTPVGAVTATAPRRDPTVTGWAIAMKPGEHERDRRDRLDDAEVVAVAGVAPLLDLEAQQREDDERRDDDPRDRRLEQAVVLAPVRHASKRSRKLR